jgi:hypothetical protein
MQRIGGERSRGRGATENLQRWVGEGGKPRAVSGGRGFLIAVWYRGRPLCEIGRVTSRGRTNPIELGVLAIRNLRFVQEVSNFYLTYQILLN